MSGDGEAGTAGPGRDDHRRGHQKRALVLGASGFIGGHLVARLKEEGYWVRAVSSRYPEAGFPRFTTQMNPKARNGADQLLACDLRDYESVAALFHGRDGHSGFFDEVYQMAADTGGATYINGGTHDALAMTSCVLIDANVARLCVANHVRKLFFPSSACVYRSTDDHSSCVEDEVYPAMPDNEYGWAKLFSERMYQSYRRNFGLDVKIARFHSIVGPGSPWHGGKEKAHSALARKVATVEDGGVIDVIGDGTQSRTFLYVDDCIDAVRLLMQSAVTEPLNIGSDQLVSIGEYIDLLKDISGKRFTGRQIAGPTGVKGRACSIAKISAALGWKPKTSLREATERTYRWIQTRLEEEAIGVT